MIVMDDGCYEYHLNHQDEMDAENDMTRPTLEASSDIFIKNIFLEKKTTSLAVTGNLFDKKNSRHITNNNNQTLFSSLFHLSLMPKHVLCYLTNRRFCIRRYKLILV